MALSGSSRSACSNSAARRRRPLATAGRAPSTRVRPRRWGSWPAPARRDRRPRGTSPRSKSAVARLRWYWPLFGSRPDRGTKGRDGAVGLTGRHARDAESRPRARLVPVRAEQHLVVRNGFPEAPLSRQRLGQQAMGLHIVRRRGQQRLVGLNRVRPISLRFERLPDGEARLPHEKARGLLKNERLELRDALVERPLAQERRAEVVARRRVVGRRLREGARSPRPAGTRRRAPCRSCCEQSASATGP